MKKIQVFSAFLLLVLSLSSCRLKDNHDVNIAVMDDPNSTDTDYLFGMQQAINDLRDDYADTDYKFNLNIYNYENNYVSGAAIIERISAEKNITAVIASDDANVTKTAAHIFNDMVIPFIIPYSLSENFYKDSYYEHVFSLAYSKYNVGDILHSVAARSSAKRWVVCLDDDEPTMSELDGFLRPQDSADDKIRLIDCISFSKFNENPGKAFRTWRLLGVEGIAMFSSPSQDRHNEFKKIKAEFPGLVYIGDSVMSNHSPSDPHADDSDLMNNCILVPEFQIPNLTDSAENENIERLIDIFRSEHGREPTMWFFHGYNMIRMIGDTAVKNHTTVPQMISYYLHKDGYEGAAETFKFFETGLLDNSERQYVVFDSNGAPELKIIE